MDADPPKKILVFNVNWLGDVIFTSPIFKALKEWEPSCHVTCMAVPRVRDILSCIPGIDDVIVYDERGIHKSILGKIRLVRRLSRCRFDMVFLLHRSWTRALLVFLAGIPQRIGYDLKNRGWLLTHRIEPLTATAHRGDHYLQVLEGYGIPVNDRRCRLEVDDSSQRDVHELLQKHGIQQKEPFVVLHVAGNWDLKRWPHNNFATLAQTLADHFHLKVVIPGTSRDIPLAQEIKRLSNKPIVVLAGQTNLKQLVSLMQRARLLISADSGPMHIASCVGTPLVALFGPTRPEITGPRGIQEAFILQKDVGCNQEPCYNLACKNNKCMQAISVDEVVRSVEKILSGY